MLFELGKNTLVDNVNSKTKNRLNDTFVNKLRICK